MASHPLARIVSQFKREPSRTGSLIITFHGDAILPRGGSVWLGTLLQFLELLEIDGGVVRTAVSRLAADGWFDRDKVGRKSFYRLAPTGRERFEAAIEHLYNPHVSDAAGRFELLLIENGSDRDSARAALTEAGFGNPLPGVWVAPNGVAVPSAAASAIRLDVAAAGDMGRRLISASWALDRMAESYRAFTATFAPLDAWIAAQDALAPSDAMLARVLLIHQYRRVILHDPLLPGELLPAAWPAAEARALCARLYRALLGPSEKWLDSHGESPAGPLPPPGAELRRRFADMLQK
ncbi:phenylacetic acid degradation operon negative regulatory protein PaaX [Bradyrhizobium sp. U87765 SZCCT0131]|uniref:phenylacetic acid degradation operon negative regulatory protein PaaX n=1 Tax=unclassified Bradyrhizobium TaxID=2631580 RepID=UPI001BADF317|nr:MULTISPECIES: phenylacetic acid degradation operon negative regulatory protein PaaX [unclassified Bradyrhizobium]MBR1221236.1 phenylacetic acid degradation operon negative regulatory protein PaaX [Bradyrhizobium sp. U87765 SZCCT0131]MBR1259943.1 phenylacetic acid degradation operon negative regulatory protein PaaX [Bradyrhizobium sp. U87765 SZCCT0134]MBR1307808.1 phenylacetic acid degradation operon negative regulatory protein PaaX [Bradyrhizobium sp. U87765 SZCCT0110]MBR1321762.1 phenylacet